MATDDLSVGEPSPSSSVQDHREPVQVGYEGMRARLAELDAIAKELQT